MAKTLNAYVAEQLGNLTLQLCVLQVELDAAHEELKREKEKNAASITVPTETISEPPPE